MKSRQSLSQASAAPRDHATQAIIGAAVGATLMYVFDPERGTRRRKRLRDRAVHRAHATADFAGTASRDAGNRVTGLAAALSSAAPYHTRAPSKSARPMGSSRSAVTSSIVSTTTPSKQPRA
jgi:ornithine cyclodeaminase/alanine dehydrogenase-like protein (mu-crystallin family)